MSTQIAQPNLTDHVSRHVKKATRSGKKSLALLVPDIPRNPHWGDLVRHPTNHRERPQNCRRPRCRLDRRKPLLGRKRSRPDWGCQAERKSEKDSHFWRHVITESNCSWSVRGLDVLDWLGKRISKVRKELFNRCWIICLLSRKKCDQIELFWRSWPQILAT